MFGMVSGSGFGVYRACSLGFVGVWQVHLSVCETGRDFGSGLPSRDLHNVSRSFGSAIVLASSSTRSCYKLAQHCTSEFLQLPGEVTTCGLCIHLRGVS